MRNVDLLHNDQEEANIRVTPLVGKDSKAPVKIDVTRRHVASRAVH
jgi:hypothetical protein